MRSTAGKLVSWWTHWGAYLLAAIFVAVVFWLTSRQYLTFNTRAADLDRFNQAIWNTLHGRFLFSTIENRSILGGHFSPYMALLAPLLLIWPDVRILTLAQTIGLAVAGLFLYRIVRTKHPSLAPWFLLAFYLNPALHEVALLELRRITLAVPYLALALYALFMRRRWLMAVGLFLALLCKEDVAILVFMVGVFLLFFEKDWRWGSALMAIAAIWILLVLLLINPALDPRAAKADDALNAYRGLRYFNDWGASLPNIIFNIARKPLIALGRMFDSQGLAALWRVFLPLGVLLPLLAPTWALIALPSMSYMLLSGQPPMHRLEDWYMASVLPVLFAAIGVGLTNRPKRQAGWLALLLLATTLIGFRLYSYAPLGGRFQASVYSMTEHNRIAAKVIASVPPEARVAAQSPYTPHLAHREFIFVFPWIAGGWESVDHFLLDRHWSSYPLSELERNDAINNLVADPANVIEIEVDGIYLISSTGAQHPSFQVDRVAEGAIHLDRVEIAPADEHGFFQTIRDEPIELRPGQTSRVTLYWQALATPEGERTVSVRITDNNGWVIAQQDMKPSNGARPTSWWQPGWQIRDVYYLTLPLEALPGMASLNILLYDSYTLEHVPFAGEIEELHIAEIVITS